MRLRAYGWDDLAARAEQPDGCQFLLDYEEEDDDQPQGVSSGFSDSGRGKKKPWRFMVLDNIYAGFNGS